MAAGIDEAVLVELRKRASDKELLDGDVGICGLDLGVGERVTGGGCPAALYDAGLM